MAEKRVVIRKAINVLIPESMHYALTKRASSKGVPKLATYVRNLIMDDLSTASQAEDKARKAKKK